MDNGFYISYKIDDRSYVSFVKREIHNLVVGKGFSAFKSGEIDIVVSELTSNLIKYAGSGELLYRVSNDDNGIFFEIFCIDGGKGINNINRMMQDGQSSSNTLGQGLGAINRLSDVFQVYTLVNWGTVQYSKIYQTPQATGVSGRQKNYDIGTLQVCAPGEQVCGDGYFVKKTDTGLHFFVGDGLGHGIKANEAVGEALQLFRESKEQDPVALLRQMHEYVKKTRGLVATVAFLDLTRRHWQICGIGNISTRIYNGLEVKNYTAYNGIIGHNIPRTINASFIPFDQNQTIVMMSDGIRTRWNLSDLPSLLKYTPSVIAASIYKDNARGNDDMTVLVGKVNFSI